MFTDNTIYWIERFRVQQSGRFVNIHRGGSSIIASTFEATWTDDWAWYIHSLDTGQYLVLQANDQNSAGGGFLTYTMSNWTIVAQSTGTMTAAEWLNQLAGQRMVVALVPSPPSSDQLELVLDQRHLMAEQASAAQQLQVSLEIREPYFDEVAGRLNQCPCWLRSTCLMRNGAYRQNHWKS